MADRQQQTQAQQKEPEVPMCDQSSENVHKADKALDEAQKDMCEENDSIHKAEGGEPIDQARQPPLPPTSGVHGEPEGGASRATEQEDADQVQQEAEQSSTPKAVPNKVSAIAH
jgi:hypothetical protein